MCSSPLPLYYTLLIKSFPSYFGPDLSVGITLPPDGVCEALADPNLHIYSAFSFYALCPPSPPSLLLFLQIN